MADIKQILINGTTYNIKDATARASIQSLQNIIAGGVKIEVVTQLPVASASTMGIIYFVGHAHGTNDSYDEYLTVESSGTYKWEKIGNTDIDLSTYSKNTHKHSVTSNVTVNTKMYTPAGSVSLPSFTSTVTAPTASVATVTSSGTAYSLNAGSMSQADSSTGSFATEGMKASVSGEVLSFAAAGTGNAVTSVGRVTYTKPSLTGSLPSFGTQTVVTSVGVSTVADGSASFTGTQANITPTLVNNAVNTSTAN